MNLKEPKNINYAATVVIINRLVDLPNCNNLQGAIINGNAVVVSKDTRIGDIGIFFPVECRLSEDYLASNNLYSDVLLNDNNAVKGYFEKHGRVRAQSFRGNRSEGFYMPIVSLTHFLTNPDIIKLKEGDTFDELNGIPICEKYIPAGTKIPQTPAQKQKVNKLRNILVDKQFKFHGETPQLKNNLDVLCQDDFISITGKLHGSSCILANVLIRRDLSLLDKIAKWLGVAVQEEEYGYIYSSGKPKSQLPKGVLGAWENKGVDYYDTNIWKRVCDDYKDLVQKGITLYGEIVGFTEDGRYIQKDYDYGCVQEAVIREPGKTTFVGIQYNFYVYRITSTNIDGETIEFSKPQVKEYCKKYGLYYVPEYYYGRAGGFYPCDGSTDCQERFLESLKDVFLEKDCTICANKVPAEGIVVAVEGGKSYKLKSYRFLQKETEDLDAGIMDMESAENFEFVSNETI